MWLKLTQLISLVTGGEEEVFSQSVNCTFFSSSFSFWNNGAEISSGASFYSNCIESFPITLSQQNTLELNWEPADPPTNAATSDDIHMNMQSKPLKTIML